MPSAMDEAIDRSRRIGRFGRMKQLLSEKELEYRANGLAALKPDGFADQMLYNSGRNRDRRHLQELRAHVASMENQLFNVCTLLVKDRRRNNDLGYRGETRLLEMYCKREYGTRFYFGEENFWPMYAKVRRLMGESDQSVRS